MTHDPGTQQPLILTREQAEHFYQHGELTKVGDDYFLGEKKVEVLRLLPIETVRRIAIPSNRHQRRAAAKAKRQR